MIDVTRVVPCPCFDILIVWATRVMGKATQVSAIDPSRSAPTRVAPSDPSHVEGNPGQCKRPESLSTDRSRSKQPELWEGDPSHCGRLGSVDADPSCSRLGSV